MMPIFETYLHQLGLPPAVESVVLELHQICLEDGEQPAQPNTNATKTQVQNQAKSEPVKNQQSQQNQQQNQQQRQQQKQQKQQQKQQQSQQNQQDKNTQQKTAETNGQNKKDVIDETINKFVSNIVEFARKKLEAEKKTLLDLVSDDSITDLSSLGINTTSPIVNGDGEYGIDRIKANCIAKNNTLKSDKNAPKLDACLGNIKKYVNASLAKVS